MSYDSLSKNKKNLLTIYTKEKFLKRIFFTTTIKTNTNGMTTTQLITIQKQNWIPHTYSLIAIKNIYLLTQHINQFLHLTPNG